MEHLQVFMEQMGEKILVGSLTGESSDDICFAYDPVYCNTGNPKPVSISLPLQSEPFSPEATRCFFDGLLPEGYTRRCVAAQISADQDDYISILKSLGKECLGALQILSAGEIPDSEFDYELMTEEQMRAFAKEGAINSAVLVTKSHLSLTGASGKTGLYYRGDNTWHIPLGCAPSTHIVKQSHVRLDRIVTNEQLCLLTAKNLGICVPESFIVRFDDGNDDSVLFATKRYDRTIVNGGKAADGELAVPRRLHQEDFAQALGIPAERKYEKNDERYLQKMFALLQEKSANPIEDLMALWRIVVFHYLIGNTDNHIKNASLIYTEDLKQIRLAPAYDIICTLIYESSTEEMALGINGKYNVLEITRDDFKKEAVRNRLGATLFMREFDRLRKELPEALSDAINELTMTGFEAARSVGAEILKQYQKRKEQFEA